MGKHVEWIVYKGKKILVVRAAGLGEADYMAALEEMKQELLKDGTGPPVLTDLRKWEMTAAGINKAKEVSAELKKEGVPFGRNALVGMTGLQKSVADLSVRHKVYYAATIDDAKEWLVKEDDRPR